MKVTLPNGVTIEPTSSDEVSWLIRVLIVSPTQSNAAVDRFRQSEALHRLRRRNLVLQSKLQRLTGLPLKVKRTSC
jgi:hypothetical protein